MFINREYETISKELTLHIWKYDSSICLEMLSKTTTSVSIASSWSTYEPCITEIQLYENLSGICVSNYMCIGL